MSGHSKWSQIKRQKAVSDQKRGQIFTKLARALTIAAKQGGENPDTNFKLRLAITKAKEANMPKSNIERAIKRGVGEEGGATFEEITYEGFGPENSLLIIEALTNNRTRTVSQLKHILGKYGGSLAAHNAVMWQFNYRGIIEIDLKQLTEEQEIILIESGALDYQLTENGVELITKPGDAEQVRNYLEKKLIPVTAVQLLYLAKEYKDIQDEKKWCAFVEELDSLDDVNNFYSNIKNA